MRPTLRSRPTNPNGPESLWFPPRRWRPTDPCFRWLPSRPYLRWHPWCLMDRAARCHLWHQVGQPGQRSPKDRRAGQKSSSRSGCPTGPDNDTRCQCNDTQSCRRKKRDRRQCQLRSAGSLGFRHSAAREPDQSSGPKRHHYNSWPKSACRESRWRPWLQWRPFVHLLPCHQWRPWHPTRPSCPRHQWRPTYPTHPAIHWLPMHPTLHSRPGRRSLRWHPTRHSRLRHHSLRWRLRHQKHQTRRKCHWLPLHHSRHWRLRLPMHPRLRSHPWRQTHRWCHSSLSHPSCPSLQTCQTLHSSP